MAISTNSIIHYTDSIEKLKSILMEGFRIKYCAEKLILEDDLKSLAAHPMISFCDIPLSQSYKHFDAYGKYGLGLTKDWAKRNGVNPVLYLDTKSSITKSLGSFIKERRNPRSNLTAIQKQEILRIKCFTKNYSGHLKRKLIDNPNYKFYDEREWRLVPEKDDLKGAKFSLKLKFYNKDKEKYNRTIADIRFVFQPKDISYIIVEKTSEIPEVISLLRIAYNVKCTAAELDILFSRICSTEEILNDY